jgi:hypothetical protein
VGMAAYAAKVMVGRGEKRWPLRTLKVVFLGTVGLAQVMNVVEE